MTILNNKLTIYFPSTQRNGDLVREREGHCLALIKEMVETFGGCTVTNGVGYWNGELGITMIEHVNLLSSSTSLTEEWLLFWAEGIATRMKTDLNQEAITLEINSTMYIL